MAKDITLIKNKDALFLKKIKKKSEIEEKNEELDGYLIDADEKETRKIVESLKGKIIAVLGKNDEFNRRILETIKINFLVSPELGERRDSLKQRDSGLNHVLAKIAKEKNISIVINLSDLNKLDKKQKALRLERIMQNIITCRKIGCKIKIATFANSKEELADEYSRKSFAFSIGMSSQQASQAINF